MGEVYPHNRNRVVLRHWKLEREISLKEWIDDLTRIDSFEQFISKINDNLDLFLKVWAPYLEMIER